MPASERGRAVGAPSEDVVGPDRDPVELAELLLAGGSVVIVGSPGTGKSHLVRAVVAELRGRGVDPLLLRPGQRTPEKSVDGPVRGGGPLVVVADDAQCVDDDTLVTLSRTAHSGGARLLITAETDPTSQTSGLPPVLAQLWLDGAAVRHDLQQLDDATADDLISCFVGTGVLDSVTRAVVTRRSAGSRMLLREFALDAAEAQRGGGHEPWESRPARAGSRLADALRTVVDGYDEEQLLGLALVGRLDGVEYSTLIRTVAPRVLDALLARRVLRGTGPHRLLHASAPIAHEAEHRLAPGRLDAAVDDLITRLLTAPGAALSAPVMRAAAAAWHAHRGTVPAPDDIPEALRGTVLATAARAANAEGRADVALAHVALGFAVDGHPALHVEASRALARLGKVDEAYAEISQLDAAAVAVSELRRLVRWWASLVGWQPAGHSLDEIEDWLEAAGVTDRSVLVELDVQRAEACYLDMDWSGAERWTGRVMATPEARTLARLRAGVVASMSAAQLGRGAEGLALLARAERMNRDPVTGRPESLHSELVLIGFQAFTGVVAKSVPPQMDARLHYAVGVAAQRKDRSGLALAGVVSGVALGFAAGDDARTELELRAALDRIDRIEFAVFRPLIGDLRASALARLGRVAEARALLDEMDIEQLRMHRLYRYSRHIAEHEIAVASGELGSAETALLAAETERAGGDPGAGASVTDLRRRERLAERLAQESGGRPAGECPPDIPSRGDEPGRVLTEREHEIALLVARRLSNKEIAQQLYLSVRTVESHIYAARGKLAATSRRELGERVHEQDARDRVPDGRL